jgi:branched-chain amino acid aminotransferase
MASHEAKGKGFDEALLTDMNGYIAEGPGANMFFELEGKLYTPAAGNILPGITRATVLEISAELDIPVEQGQYTLEQLKAADAAFFCGTAAEVIGWASIDDYTFPMPWKETQSRKIQLAYKDRVTERQPQLETI